MRTWTWSGSARVFRRFFELLARDAERRAGLGFGDAPGLLGLREQAVQSLGVVAGAGNADGLRFRRRFEACRLVPKAVDIFERSAQFAIIGETLFGLALHHFLDEMNPAGRDIGFAGDFDRERFFEMAPDDVFQRGAVKGLLTGHQMEEGGAEGIDVGALVGRRSGNLLRGNISGSAEGLALGDFLGVLHDFLGPGRNR